MEPCGTPANIKFDCLCHQDQQLFHAEDTSLHMQLQRSDDERRDNAISVRFNIRNWRMLSIHDHERNRSVQLSHQFHQRK